MGDKRDTPPTGTAIPRPIRKLEKVPAVSEAQPTPEPLPDPEPLPPSNPTIADVYKLIDRRLSPLIVQRISSTPPPPSSEQATEPQPRPSLPVRMAKRSPKWLAYALAALTVIGQGIAAASREEYRGPIVQAVKLIAIGVSELFADDPQAPPDTTPE